MDKPLSWPEITFRKGPVMMGHVFHLSDEPKDEIFISFNAEQIWAPDSEICDHPPLDRSIRRDNVLWNGRSGNNFEMKREVILESHPDLVLQINFVIFTGQKESKGMTGFLFSAVRIPKNKPEFIEKFEIFRLKDHPFQKKTPPSSGFRIVGDDKVFEYFNQTEYRPLLMDIQNTVQTSELSKILDLGGFFK